MKGLLLKDYYLSVKYYKSYVLILFIFAGMSIWAGSNPFLIGYPFMLIGMMAPGLQNMDEGCKWDVYCGAMPCTKRQIVTEKYLYGMIWSVLGLAIVAVAQLIRIGLNEDFYWSDLWGNLSVCLVMTFLYPAISMPFVFKLGAEKGRIFQYLVMGFGVGIATFLSMTQDDSAVILSVPQSAYVRLILGAAVVCVLSWLLSIRFYEKREIR